ncbi:MAG: ATP-binding cassette domain-containing protein, partial [Bifidobacteriaceae bacterium]|nr:ATP-binding cassette domain-containing protein [Bifidobacteriaceae bacterium]
HDFYEGKVSVIMGPSGSGKTTILALLAALTKPTEGKVLYDGNDLNSIDPYDYRSHNAGVVFQSFNLLYDRTVLENIILSMEVAGIKASKQEKRDLAVNSLKMAGLNNSYADRLPLSLSGGEQQRVAIARTLAYSPRVILADEPTGALDPDTQKSIMNVLCSLAHEKGKCVIIVTHSKEVAAATDDMTLIKDSKTAQQSQIKTSD